MKRCSRCKIELPLEDFAIRKNRPGNLQSHCRSCQKKYRRNHYLKNKEKYIRKAALWRVQERQKFIDFLDGKICVDCGMSDTRCLEFDHLGDKQYNISEKVGEVRFEVLLLEIEKCDIVCANCHRIRTFERGQFARNLITV